MAQNRYRHCHELRQKKNNLVDKRLRSWIPAENVKPFKILFERIREKVGTYDGAREYIGLGCSTMDNFEKGKITKETGERIVAAYRKITEHGV